jgi:hypothetical protein
VFISYLDYLFDFLNCRSWYGKGYESAINASKAMSRISFLLEAQDMLLKIAGQ